MIRNDRDEQEGCARWKDEIIRIGGNDYGMKGRFVCYREIFLYD